VDQAFRQVLRRGHEHLPPLRDQINMREILLQQRAVLSAQALLSMFTMILLTREVMPDW